jgi:hypothetical protein
LLLGHSRLRQELAQLIASAQHSLLLSATLNKPVLDDDVCGGERGDAGSHLL